MMDDEERYVAASWFVAGFVAAQPEWVPGGRVRSVAITSALDHLERHREGRCLACHRPGVVILDGYFCERCAPGTSELLDEYDELMGRDE